MLLSNEVRAMEFQLKKAFVTAIGLKIRSLIFYRAISAKVKNSNVRQVFEQLAKEVAEQLTSICNNIQGNEEELANILTLNNSCADSSISSLLDLIDKNISGINALRIALAEEKLSVGRFTLLVETISEPVIHQLFARILNETRQQLEMISAEYSQLTGLQTGKVCLTPYRRRKQRPIMQRPDYQCFSR